MNNNNFFILADILETIKSVTQPSQPLVFSKASSQVEKPEARPEAKTSCISGGVSNEGKQLHIMS